jgi:hypothetical protein
VVAAPSAGLVSPAGLEASSVQPAINTAIVSIVNSVNSFFMVFLLARKSRSARFGAYPITPSSGGKRLSRAEYSRNFEISSIF